MWVCVFNKGKLVFVVGCAGKLGPNSLSFLGWRVGGVDVPNNWIILHRSKVKRKYRILYIIFRCTE